MQVQAPLPRRRRRPRRWPEQGSPLCYRGLVAPPKRADAFPPIDAATNGAGFPVISHGAGFLVQGYLMRQSILTYRAPPRQRGIRPHLPPSRPERENAPDSRSGQEPLPGDQRVDWNSRRHGKDTRVQYSLEVGGARQDAGSAQSTGTWIRVIPALGRYARGVLDAPRRKRYFWSFVAGAGTRP
jgi:hypothetical protein